MPVAAAIWSACKRIAAISSVNTPGGRSQASASGPITAIIYHRRMSRRCTTAAIRISPAERLGSTLKSHSRPTFADGWADQGADIRAGFRLMPVGSRQFAEQAFVSFRSGVLKAFGEPAIGAPSQVFQIVYEQAVGILYARDGGRPHPRPRYRKDFIGNM